MKLPSLRVTQTKPALLTALSFAALLQINSEAHHLSSALYDTQTDTSVEGEIVRVEWRNPHVYFYLAIDTENNEPVILEVESPPPAVFRRAGWTRDTLRIGERVIVNGNPSRDPDRNIFLFDSLLTTDNTQIGLDSALASLPEQDAAILERAISLEGTWGTSFSLEANMLLIQSSRLDLTARGRADVESYVEETDNPALNCIPSTSPATMLVPDIKKIEVLSDVVLIRGEYEAMLRTVYLDRVSHGNAIPSMHGHSIGYLEGNTLTVDTTHFAPHRNGNAAGLPSGVGKHLIETFSLNNEGSHITYSYILEDPDYLMSSIRGEVQFAYRPDLGFVEIPCDLENARRFAQ